MTRTASLQPSDLIVFDTWFSQFENDLRAVEAWKSAGKPMPLAQWRAHRRLIGLSDYFPAPGERPKRQKRRRRDDGQPQEGRQRRAAFLPPGFAELGLDMSATFELAKARYRSLAMETHPDRGGNAAEFKRLQRAFELAAQWFSDADRD